MLEGDHKSEDLAVKVKLSVDDSQNVGRFQTQVADRKMELTTFRVAVSQPAKALDVMTRAHCTLPWASDAMNVARSRLHGLLRDFIEWA